MTVDYIIPLADSRASLAVAGGKGASLARLAAAGLPVPDGFHITTAAYQQFVWENNLQSHILGTLIEVDLATPATLETASQQIKELFIHSPIPAEVAGAIAKAYDELPEEYPAVAVRSSATAEDLPDLSFAGQQESFLNIEGVDEVLGAVKRCWASLWTARAIGYRARNQIDSRDLSLAVVVQRMVPADAAGVMFTANPVTGQRDQAVINAAWGLGEAIVAGEVTPDVLMVEKHSGRILEREVSDKKIMTGRMKDGTVTLPVPDKLRRIPVLDDRKAAELVELGVKIEELYGAPTDIEWTLVDGKFSIVQARPITALPKETLPAPSEWPMPDPKGRYLRTSIIDFMPDPLSPLFATMGLRALNAGFVRLSRYIGGSDAAFLGESFFTINGYAYLKANYSAGEWWWMLSRMLPSFPRMLRDGIPHWRDEARPAYLKTLERWRSVPLFDLAPEEILSAVDDVLEAAVDLIGSLMAGTMGASAGSEGLFTNIYNKLAMRPEDPPAPTFLMGYDSVPIQAEKSLYDLAMWCRERQELVAYLLGTPTEQLIGQLEKEQPPLGIGESDWYEWQSRFKLHLEKFGHIIYDLDFSKPLPLNDPTPMLESCKMYLRGEGTDPHERQRRLAERRQMAVQDLRARLKGLRGKIVRKALSWAQTLAEVREDGIADIGLGYPLLRRMLLELGERFFRAGAVEQANDIFWLTEEEVRLAVKKLKHHEPQESRVDEIRERKMKWQAEKRVTPPAQLPPSKTYMGFNIESFMAFDEGSQVGGSLKGMGASPGRVTATACVLHGPQDFDKMQAGGVLVAPITTPAWTPLFAMASAIVTDVGGPLSHGSIVAREYGIPAVLGTGVATRRIQSGQVVTVDGDRGMVILPNGDKSNE